MTKAMETRREIRAMFTTLVVINALMALGAIGLFGRMGPAIEEIMLENEFSIEAAQSMLEQLTRAPLATTSIQRDQLQERFEHQLDQASSNITEDTEAEALGTIESNYADALDGSPSETTATIDALTHIIEINRAKMKKADGSAQQLGIAGAWAAVLLGGFSFLFGLIVFRRMDKRIIAPLEELHEVTDEALNGRGLRRCHTAEAPEELRQILDNTNRLLDRLPIAFEEHAKSATGAGFDSPWKGDS